MIKRILIFILDVVILFGFLFEIPIIGPLTTRRLSLVMAIIGLVLDYEDTKVLIGLLRKNLLRRALWLYIICFLIAFFNVSLASRKSVDAAYFEPWYILYIYLYVFLFAVYSVKEFKNIKYFGYVLFTCFGIQAIVVYASVLFAPIRLVVLQLFNSNFVDEYEMVVENGSRIMGIGLSFSTGSIICSACGAFLTFMTIKKQLSFTRYLLLYAVLVSMTVFIGRTGVVVELLLLTFVFITQPKFIVKYSLGLVTILLLLILVITNFISNGDILNEYIIEWMTAPFTKEGRTNTLEGIHQAVPEFSSRFILGTGVMQGRLPQGDYMYSDCGYVMIYSALGIVGAILYYLANLNLYRSVLRNIKERLPKLFILFLIILAFVIEYKEPFMQKYLFSYILLTIGLFQLNNQRYVKK